MSTNPTALLEERLALTSAELARLLAISQRHLWTLNSQGKIPAPVRLGGSTRWNADELRRWLAAGCPSRDQWQSMRG